MRELVTFYDERLGQLQSDDPWQTALASQVNEPLISSLIDTCRDLKVESPKDYRKNLQNIISLALLGGGETLKPILKNLKHQGYWKEFQLGEALYALACDFLGMAYPLPMPKQHSKGSLLLETGGHFQDGGVPDLVMSAELALIWLYLGWKHSHDALLHAGLKWVHMAMAFFDHENQPFHGLWLRDSDYDPLSFLTLYSLLFSVASHLTVGSKIGSIKEALCSRLSEIEDEAFKQTPHFLSLLARAFETLSKEKGIPEIDERFTLSDVDENLGFLKTHHHDMSLACSFSGVNTGLGALHKSQVQIVSFGPHFSPLADSNQYGIYRTATGIQNPMRDLHLAKDKESFEVRGWTKLISPFSNSEGSQNFTKTQSGKQWLFFSGQNQGEKIILQSRLSDINEQKPLFFAYFISADKACVQGEMPFLPGTLSHYQGPSSPLFFERGGERLTLTPQQKSEMHLIPLEGKHHFWSADFLVAFPLNEERKAYSWAIH